ncbi:mitochondrial potassium channel ATP-binding subunit isoform X3 [Arvicanthis niloticus]|uniref:mitochondrial potassium channel ATP-binding subunit isoform X3 n=1 Tax=Arvicanthis niloticus TaxID=61156 RepID=UPI00148715FF|nr:mitochondrial potassium channel ATP-binding subunit isoform X2 [Arvicanthis niloticus]
MLVHLFRVGIRGGPVPGWSLQSLRFQTFSATRSSDDRFSSCLLRAVAQLRSQLRAHLPRTPPASHRSPSAWCWVGGTLVVPAVLWQHPRLCLIARCEAKGSPPAQPTRGPELRFNWKLFWHFLHPHLLALGVAIVLALGAALVNVQIPLLLGQLVEIVAKYTRDHMGSFVFESRKLSIQLFLLYGVQGLLTFGYLVLLSHIGERMATDMRQALFSSLLRQDIAFFDAKKTGQLVSRLTTDVQEFKSSFKLVISQGLRSCTQVIGSLVSLSMLSPRLTLILAIVTPALMGVGTLMGSGLRKLSRQCQEQIARATGVADEALGNVRTVRAFAMEKREEEYGLGNPVHWRLPCGWTATERRRPHVLPGGIPDSTEVYGQPLCPVWSGKTTVASLLERFYDPAAGTVMLDGHDLRTLDPSWLRGQVIGFISQEPVLFATTIMENIRFGKLDASDEEVYTAAREANAHGFISSFPDGYSTVIGERGTTLSGGQKQRLAIARALVKQPTVLILDEATSALDAESERVVQEALDRASAGRTVLVIAHRLSTVRAAHSIIVMANGQVCEAGTHEELLKKGGLYAELIRRQALDASLNSPLPAEKPGDPRHC